MADGEDTTPASPPLPKKGSYNIDFDSLDDSINPFQSKPKITFGSSPPINPAPPLNLDEADLSAVDPFKPKTVLAKTPPGSPKLTPRSNNNVGETDPTPDVSTNAVVDPASSEKEVSDTDKALALTKEDGQPEDAKHNTQVTPKKKKIVKKKVQSKIKTPKVVKPVQEDSDDIQIFMPDADKSPPAKEESLPISPDTSETPKEDKLDSSISEKDDVMTPPQIKPAVEETEKSFPPEHEDSDVPYDAAPDAMASSSEIDQQFVNRDDMDEPEQPNEGMATNTHEEMDKPSEWDIPENLKKEEEVDTTPQKSKKPKKKVDSPPTAAKEKLAKPSSQGGIKASHHSEDDLLMKSAPPAEGSNSKHPAARALEAGQVEGGLKVADVKNESSSEEGPFYDAYDYPPAQTTKSKLGQKNSAAMERVLNHEEGGDNKVVQLVQVLRYSQSDWNRLKQEMELNFQTSLLNKEREWSLMLAERDKKILALEESNRKLKHTNEDMRMVVADFEKTISQLQAEKERTKKDSSKTAETLEVERDQALEDLQSVETAFSDLHRRYEKSKSIIEGFKRNEEQLKQCVEDLQNKLKKSESKLQSIRSQAEEKLDRANEDIEKVKKQSQQDLVRLEAALKKAELRTSSLEESLQRKEKENQELTAICDELIAKVGS